MNSNGKNSSRVANMAILRVVVSGYLVYLGASMIRERLNGSSTLPVWAVWVLGLVFILAGLGFGVYSWKQYRAASQQSGEEGKPAEEPTDGDGPEDPET